MNQSVDLVLTVSSITSFLEVDKLLGESSIWRRELEWHQKFVDTLELVSAGKELVDHVFNTDDILLAKRSANHRVVGDGLSLLVDIDETTFVHKFLDCLQVGVTISDEWFDQTKHLDGSLVQTDEHAIVDLTKTEKLKNLSGLGVNTVDTANTDHEGNLGFGFTVEVSSFLGLKKEEKKKKERKRFSQ